MTFEEWYESFGIILPSWRDKVSLVRAWNAGAESRYAEVSELKQTCIDHVEIQNALREQVTMLRGAIRFFMKAEGDYDLIKAGKKFKKALAATKPKRSIL